MKKVILNFLVEKISFIFLLPLILIQKNTQRKIRNILFVEPFQMGDILSLTPLIDPLLQKYPGVKIFFLTKPTSGAVLQYDPRVSKVFTVDFPWSDHGKKKMSLDRVLKSLRYVFALRKNNFDLGIDTRGDLRSQILLILTGCSRRVGYLNYLHSNLNLSGLLLTQNLFKSKYQHRYEWNLYLLTALGFTHEDLFPIQFPCYKPDRLPTQLNLNSNAVLIHVGGGWEYRRWSNFKWIELLHKLLKKGHNNILVIGGPGEKNILSEIKAGLYEQGQIEFNVSTLEELIDSIQKCSLFIGLDSGPMNLASCLNKKIIALFGPGDASIWRPINKGGKFIQKVENFQCSPCLQITCIFPEKNCMHEIEVDDILRILNSFS